MSEKDAIDLQIEEYINTNVPPDPRPSQTAEDIMIEQQMITAMQANLDLMLDLLGEATRHVSGARLELSAGRRNGAIGAMPGTDQLLHTALALFTATRALHQHRRPS